MQPGTLLQKYIDGDKPNFILRVILGNGKYRDFLLHFQMARGCPRLQETLDSAENNVAVNRAKRAKREFGPDRLTRILEFNTLSIPELEYLHRAGTAVMEEDLFFSVELFLQHVYTMNLADFLDGETCPVDHCICEMGLESEMDMCTSHVGSSRSRVFVSVLMLLDYFEVESVTLRRHLVKWLVHHTLYSTENHSELKMLKIVLRRHSTHFLAEQRLLNLIVSALFSIGTMRYAGVAPCNLLDSLVDNNEVRFERVGELKTTFSKCIMDPLLDCFADENSDYRWFGDDSGFFGELLCTDKQMMSYIPMREYLWEKFNYKCKMDEMGDCICRHRTELVLEKSVSERNLAYREFRLTFGFIRDLRFMDGVVFDNDTTEVIHVRGPNMSVSVTVDTAHGKTLSLNVCMQSRSKAKGLGNINRVPCIEMEGAVINAQDQSTLSAMYGDGVCGGSVIDPDSDLHFSNMSFHVSKSRNRPWSFEGGTMHGELVQLTDDTHCNSEIGTYRRECGVRIPYLSFRAGESITEWEEFNEGSPIPIELECLPPRVLVLRGSITFRVPNINN